MSVLRVTLLDCEGLCVISLHFLHTCLHPILVLHQIVIWIGVFSCGSLFCFFFLPLFLGMVMYDNEFGLK